MKFKLPFVSPKKILEISFHYLHEFRCVNKDELLNEKRQFVYIINGAKVKLKEKRSSEFFGEKFLFRTCLLLLALLEPSFFFFFSLEQINKVKSNLKW